MQIARIRTSYLMALNLFLFINASAIVAEEKVIQKEELSFGKCLEVINTSANKLSIAPEVNDITNQRRVAIFTLVDGTLTITCNGKDNTIIVSTNMN